MRKTISTTTLECNRTRPNTEEGGGEEE